MLAVCINTIMKFKALIYLPLTLLRLLDLSSRNHIWRSLQRLPDFYWLKQSNEFQLGLHASCEFCLITENEFEHWIKSNEKQIVVVETARQNMEKKISRFGEPLENNNAVSRAAFCAAFECCCSMWARSITRTTRTSWTSNAVVRPPHLRFSNRPKSKQQTSRPWIWESGRCFRFLIMQNLTRKLKVREYKMSAFFVLQECKTSSP